MEDQSHLGENALHHGVQSLAPRAGHDRAVEVLVRRRHRLHVHLREAFAPLIHPDRELARAAGAPHQSPGFDDPTRAIHLAHVFDGRFLHEHATVGHTRDDPLGTQSDESLAEGVARYPERFSQVFLGEFAPRQQVAIGDPAAQNARHPLGRLGPLQLLALARGNLQNHSPTRLVRAGMRDPHRAPTAA